MSRVYLSIEQVEELLPEVERRLRTLIFLDEEIRLLSDLKIKNIGQEFEDYMLVLNMKQQYHEKLSVFYQELLELTKKGCVIKDLKKGLVDFYSKRGETDIFLCWRLGERGIKYWHDPYTGYTNRQPVEVLKAEYEREIRRFK